MRSPLRSVLVTGTDTGVGKTVVACAVIHALRQDGLRVGVWKPAETGWDSATAEHASDAARLRAASGVEEPLDAICSYQLRAPLAPAIAARLEGVSIDATSLRRTYEQRRSDTALTVVEGAGGLLVPIAGGMTYLDLARDLGLALLIVAANRLGVINHTALTARVAMDASVPVVGFILNDAARRDVPDVSADTNRDAISDLTGLTCLGELAHDPLIARDAAQAARHLDIDGIRRGLVADAATLRRP
jgi:dethiobiotin synthetase